VCKILIVEDMRIISDDIKEVVIGFGNEVIGAVANSKTAMVIAGKNNIDIALVDINLEVDYEGIALAEKLNSEYGINIIFISSYDEAIVKDINYEFEFLSKPYDEHKLHRLIDKIVESHKK